MRSHTWMLVPNTYIHLHGTKVLTWQRIEGTGQVKVARCVDGFSWTLLRHSVVRKELVFAVTSGHYSSRCLVSDHKRSPVVEER